MIQLTVEQEPIRRNNNINSSSGNNNNNNSAAGLGSAMEFCPGLGMPLCQPRLLIPTHRGDICQNDVMNPWTQMVSREKLETIPKT